MEAVALPRAARGGLTAAGQARVLRLAGDERLGRAVAAGSDAAFEVLYERHHRPLLAFCRHMLGNRDEAEDALQSTFMAAYRELRSGAEPPVELRAWLYTIARHRCRRTLHARKQHELDEARPVLTEGLGDQVQRRAELRAILGDLAQLPEDQRAALLLAQLHGMSHEEIGVVLEVPTKKVKALVFQARESLAANREARAIPCSEIRAQLAELSGGALRRRPLQRHLRACEGCREFRAQLRSQRTLLAAALPVVPSAGLREAVLGATTGGAASASGAGGLLAGAVALKGAALNLAVGAGATAALAGGLAAGGGLLHPSRHAAPPAAAAVGAPHANRSAAEPVRTATVPAVPSSARRLHAAPTATLAPRHRRHHGRGVAPPAGTQRGANAGDSAPTNSETSAAPASESPASQSQGSGSGIDNGRGNDNGNGTADGTSNPKANGSQRQGTPASGKEAPASAQDAPAGNQGTPASQDRPATAQGTPSSGEGGGSQGRGALGQGANNPAAAVSRGSVNGGGPATAPSPAKG
jgi:RNA polymerase sigma factor (sigma-70 family)